MYQFHPERLRQARENLNLTQRQLAQVCGVNEIQISRYETGRTEPSLDNLAAIAFHLQVSVDYLLGLQDGALKPFNAAEINENEYMIVDTFRREGWPGVIRLGAERITK